MSDREDDLQKRVRAWEGRSLDSADPTGALQKMARLEGIDFATLHLYEQLLMVPANARFLTRAHELECAQTIAADVVGIVPGAFHREHRNTGADGGRILQIARELGCEAEVIPVGNFGTLEANAQTISRWLGQNRGKRVALLSLSKGSADVKQALRSPRIADQFAELVAWVSLSGLVQGTPLIGWLRRRPLRWWSIRLLFLWRRWSARALLELQHGVAGVLSDWPALPPHLRVVHVYGFPLVKHLNHPWAPKAHRRLLPLGPNDGGGVLLGDLPLLPGIICPVWGADHYLTPTWDADALLRGIVAAAVEPRQASQSANAPTKAPASKSSA